MKGVLAMTLAPAAAADQLRQPLLVVSYPRYGQDPCGDSNDAETQEHHHRGQQTPQRRWATLDQHTAALEYHRLERGLSKCPKVAIDESVIQITHCQCATQNMVAVSLDWVEQPDLRE